MLDALKNFKDTPKYQRLHIEYEQFEDPDLAYSVIPYKKGSSFLYHLERTVGGLDNWIREFPLPLH